jgi:hypothetical protein
VPRKRKKSSIENALNVEDKNHFRESIARIFYSGGLSFHLARNPYYVSSFLLLLITLVASFFPGPVLGQCNQTYRSGPQKIWGLKFFYLGSHM